MPTAPFLAPDRDTNNRLPRGRSAGTNFYVTPGVSSRDGGVLAMTAGVDYYFPFHTPAPIFVDQLAIHVQTANATNARFGLYLADEDLQPVGKPLTDSGNVSVGTTGVKTFTPSSPVYVPRGPFLGVINCEGTPTLYTVTSNPIWGSHYPTTLTGNTANRFRVTRAYAAFPTPGTAWDTTTSDASGGYQSILFLRISAP